MLKSEKIGKILKKDKFKSEMIWTICMKRVKRYEKYRRKLWNDKENTKKIVKNLENIGER
jgi:hypothetical protein